jgi:hypothetical protein
MLTNLKTIAFEIDILLMRVRVLPKIKIITDINLPAAIHKEQTCDSKLLVSEIMSTFTITLT